MGNYLGSSGEVSRAWSAPLPLAPATVHQTSALCLARLQAGGERHPAAGQVGSAGLGSWHGSSSHIAARGVQPCVMGVCDLRAVLMEDEAGWHCYARHIPSALTASCRCYLLQGAAAIRGTDGINTDVHG